MTIGAMMKAMNSPSSNIETPPISTAIETGVLFVDLDETLLDGTVVGMTDEELAVSGLIDSTVSKIKEVKANGTKVVMVTRNSAELMERFFEAHLETRALFDRTIACETGNKSGAINGDLKRSGSEKKQAYFLDDNGSERNDVETNTENVTTLHPREAATIQFRSKLDIHIAS